MISLVVLFILLMIAFKIICISRYSDVADKALDKLVKHIEEKNLKIK